MPVRANGAADHGTERDEDSATGKDTNVEAVGCDRSKRSRSRLQLSRTKFNSAVRENVASLLTPREQNRNIIPVPLSVLGIPSCPNWLHCPTTIVTNRPAIRRLRCATETCAAPSRR